MLKTREMTIGDYEAIKCDTLRKYGCPENELWLTECTSMLSFKRFYGYDTAEDLFNNKSYQGVVYYHEGGDLHAIAGFNDIAEFEEACKYIAKYLEA